MNVVADAEMTRKEDQRRQTTYLLQNDLRTVLSSPVRWG